MTDRDRGIRVLLVAPGPRFSTFDMFQYYRDALARRPEVAELTCFNYHVYLEYHATARKEYYGEHENAPGFKEAVVARATRELLTEVWVTSPDVVLFIDGTQMQPEIFQWMQQFRDDSGRDFITSVYITESPYLDDVNFRIMSTCDVSFINDKRGLRDFQSRNRGVAHYLGHSFASSVHYPDLRCSPNIDVFCCGRSMRNAPTARDVDGIGLSAAYRVRQHLLQIGAVEHEVGEAVAFDGFGAKIEQLLGLAGVPDADFLTVRFPADRLDLGAQTELVEHAGAIGTDLEAGADLHDFGRLLVDVDVEAAFEQ